MNQKAYRSEDVIYRMQVMKVMGPRFDAKQLQTMCRIRSQKKPQQVILGCVYV
jgi:hypothetical protein